MLPAEIRTGRLTPARRWSLGLGAYAVILAFSLEDAHRSGGMTSTAYWNAGLAVALVTAALVAWSGPPPAFYGLTTRGALASLRSAAVVTAALTAGCLTLTWGLIEAGLLERSTPVLSIEHEPELLVYAALAAPIQELIFRGVFQSCARHAFRSRPRGAALALLVSTAAYAVSHLPWGWTCAAVTLVPGLAWGLMFERDRTLLGVMLSHAIVGYVVVGATPLWRVLTAYP